MYHKDNPFEKGYIFEEMVEHVLNPIVAKYDWRILSDVKLPSSSKIGFSQIDFVLFTPQKYICIEAKGWNGETEYTDREFWEVKYNDRYYKVLSPLKQNFTHVRRMCEYVDSYKVSGIICFSNSAIVKNKTPSVVAVSEIPIFLEQISKGPALVTQEEMLEDYSKIRKVNVACLLREVFK